MHCSLQSSPLYWRFTVPNVSSIVGMLPGTHFLWWRAVLLSHFPESPLWFGNDVLSKWVSVWEMGKSLLGLSPENRVDGVQRMSDVLPDNCGWGATREPAHCRGGIPKSGFHTIPAYSCAQHPSNALKLSGTPVCLPSDHMVQIHERQRLFNRKTQPATSWSLTDTSVLFWLRRPFPHPLRRLRLGFNIIPINPRLISCYDVLKKCFVTICIGKQFLNDFNTVLFLIVSQQTRHEFCTDVTIWSFSVKIWWQDPMLMLISSATSRTVKRRFPRITARTLDMVVVCWCEKSSRTGIFTDRRSALFNTLKTLITLRSAHAVLLVCLFKQLKCLCRIFTKFAAIFHTQT